MPDELTEVERLRQRVAELEASEGRLGARLERAEARAASTEEADALLTELLERIPDYIYFKDRSRRFVRTSRSIELLLGFGPGGIVGKRDEDIFPAQVVEESIADDQRVIEEGIPLLNKMEGGEFADGVEHWVSTTKLPWRDPDGQVRGLYGISRDVTQIKLSQDRLKESEARLRQILDSLYGFVGQLTVEGVLVQANRAPLEAAGIEAKDVLGEPFWETYWWSYDSAVQERLRDVLRRAAAGELVRYEDRVRVLEGALIDLDLSFGPLRAEDGTIEGILGFGVDVTERTRAENELRATRDRLQATLAALPDLLFEVDGEGRVHRFSAPESEMLYMPPEEFLGKTMREILPPAAGDVIMTAVSQAVEEGRSASVLYSLDMPAGETWYEASMARTRESPESDCRVVMLVRDVTERKQAEEATREQARRQEILVQEINHRVRNNLASILGMLGIERARAAQSTRTTLEVLDAVDYRIRAVGIAHDVLTENHWRPLSLSVLCEKVVRATTLAREGAGSGIEVDVAPTSRMVSTRDVHHFALALAELTTNATKYGRAADGGLRIEVSFGSVGPWFVLLFRDGGPGYPESVVSGVRAADHLGLDLVEGIVSHSLRGELEFSCDGGAVATLRLPDDGAVSG